MSSRKSVSAAASSSSIRRSAWPSLVRKPRMVTLASSLSFLAPPARRGAGGTGRLGDGLAADLGAALARPARLFGLFFGPFLAFAALALFGFFMGFLLNEGLLGFTKTG